MEAMHGTDGATSTCSAGPAFDQQQVDLSIGLTTASLTAPWRLPRGSRRGLTCQKCDNPIASRPPLRRAVAARTAAAPRADASEGHVCLILLRAGGPARAERLNSRVRASWTLRACRPHTVKLARACSWDRACPRPSGCAHAENLPPPRAAAAVRGARACLTHRIQQLAVSRRTHRPLSRFVLLHSSTDAAAVHAA
jgi:hypothetical protein